MNSCERMTFKVSILLLALVIGFAGTTTMAQHDDNKGTEFVMVFLQNFTGGANVELHLTSDQPIDVMVEWPMGAPTFFDTVAVAPGSITIVVVPSAAAQGWTNGIVQSNAVRAFSDSEFVCYMINRQGFTSDAALGLPVDVMNTEYIVINNTGTTIGSWDGGEFGVVAPFDNTTVTITPTKD
ncbi:MAG: hypothetical protein ACE5FH_03825, partial [Candidatus Zixiibacteriota bacterium]